jgi:hypothetical protein
VLLDTSAGADENEIRSSAKENPNRAKVLLAEFLAFFG